MSTKPTASTDILTVPTHILENIPFHPLTQAGMKSFFDDSQAFDK